MPLTVQNATINLGGGGNTGTLRYVSTGESTDRAFNLAGTTGGGGFQNDGTTGALVAASNINATGSGQKILTLGGLNTAANTLSGSIIDSSGNAASQNGTWASGINGISIAAITGFSVNQPITAASGIPANTVVTSVTAAPTGITASANSGANITVSNSANIAVGMSISGTNIPANSYVTAIVNGTTITINNTPSSAPSGTMTFSAALGLSQATTTLQTSNLTVTSPNTTGITKEGTGSWTLSGANTLTGPVTVRGGGLTLDYSTNDPISAGSAVTLDGGTLTFKGKVGATSDTLASLALSANGPGTNKLVLDGSAGAVNLTATTLGGSAGALASCFIDLSSNASNTLTLNAIGTNYLKTSSLLVSASGGASRANIIVKDSTGIGYATISGATSGTVTRISDVSLTTLPASNIGSGAANYLYNGTNSSITVGNGTNAFANNSITVDSSAGTATLNLAANSTLNGNSAGLLVRGSNSVTINTAGGSNVYHSGTWIVSNYLSGTAALNLNGNLSQTALLQLNGPGLTVYSGTALGNNNTNGINLSEGTLRVTTASDWSTLGTTGISATVSNGWFRNAGGVLEVGADLNGATAGDFTNAIVTAAGANGITFYGDSGVSAFGGNRIVNFGGAGATLVWGASGFLVNPGTTNGDGQYAFKLSSAYSDSTVEVQNGINLNGRTRVFDVANGSAATDARLSGNIVGGGVGGIVKNGAGTLALTGANTYTGTTTISAGSLQLGSGGTTGTLSPSSAIVNNSNLTINRSNAVAQGTDFSGSAISGSGSFTQAGSGTTTLTASNTYTGKTTVANGTLSFNSGNASATAAQALGASNTVDLGVAGTSSGNLTYTGAAGTLAKNINALGNGNDTIQNSGSGLLTLSGTLSNNGTTLTLKGGSNGIDVTGTIAGSSANSNLVVGGGTVTLSSANTYNGPTYIRNGGILNANGINALPTANGRSNLILDDTGSGSSKLTLGTAQSAASLTGATSSTVDLNANTLTIGSSTNTMTTFAGIISGTGTGGVTKDGISTQILSGPNTYDGLTTVNAGTLLINGDQSAANGNVTVNVDATLGGMGKIGGVTIVHNGGKLTGGTNGTIETLSFTNTLTMSSGSTWLVDLAGGTTPTSDRINVTSQLILGGATLQINDSAWTYGNTFVLAQYGGSFGSLGTFTFNSAPLSNGALFSTALGQYQIDYNADLGGGFQGITLTAVPEPSTFAILPALLIGGIALARRRMNRNRKTGAQ